MKGVVNKGLDVLALAIIISPIFLAIGLFFNPLPIVQAIVLTAGLTGMAWKRFYIRYFIPALTGCSVDRRDELR